MKHADAHALQRLATLLAALRRMDALREPRPGCFYLKSAAFLHFHEDSGALFADVKLDRRHFSRLAASTPAQQQLLLDAVVQALSG
jgi:hypothetical protein